jgi:hypothetical protein
LRRGSCLRACGEANNDDQNQRLQR